MEVNSIGLNRCSSAEEAIDPARIHEILGRHLLVDGLPMVFDLEGSHGSYVLDSRTGVEYLDFFSFFASLPIGFNHPKMATPYWKSRLLRAAMHKPSSSDAYTEDMASFVETFSAIALPDGFKHLFFIEGGTLGVENALKAAFDWKARKRMARGLPPGDLKVLHFREAFHGRSGYTLSLTNTDPVKTDLFPKFDWPRVLNPKRRFPVDDVEGRRIVEAERTSLAEIDAAFRRHPDQIASIILETIQGEGGDNHFRTDFLQALREIADRQEAMLIFDEVQCGFGLTGRMWAFEHHGVKPDLVAFGKKSQVCGFMAGPRIDEIPDNVFKVPSRINSTWGGSLVDMVRCEAYLKIIREDELLENACHVGDRLFVGLIDVAKGAKGKIDNVRGQGLMCAFDVATSDLRKEILQRALDEKLLIMPCGPRSIRIRPPLTLSPAEADQGLERLARALGKVAAP